jgi:hypothetical protein
MGILSSVASGAKTLWAELTGWVSGEITDLKLWATAEGKVIANVVAPILKAGEVDVLADLVGATNTFLTDLKSVGSLADIETAIIQVWETEQPTLATFAKGLGSNVFQAIIGLLLSQLPKVAAAA